MIEYPVFLGGDTIHLLAYPVESAIAEKLEAMVALGGANSRMKDFYDIWICSQHLDFAGSTLGNAVDATFKNRQTPVPAGDFEALTPEFAEAHRTQWNVFVRKMGEGDLIDAFDGVIAHLKRFGLPVLQAVARGEEFSRHWKAGTQWIEASS